VQPDEPADPARYIEELRAELGVRTRQWDRLAKDYRALTAEVTTGLATPGHHKTMYGGLPFCACGLSLGGGDASGAFITHALAVLREERSTRPATLPLTKTPASDRQPPLRRGSPCPIHGGTLFWLGGGNLICEYDHGYQIPDVARKPQGRPR
jgi:hypothetical protein